jgi:hypothetical protein
MGRLDETVKRPGDVDPDGSFLILEGCTEDVRRLRVSDFPERPRSPKANVGVGILKEVSDVLNPRGILQPAEDPCGVEPDLLGHPGVRDDPEEEWTRGRIAEIRKCLGRVETQRHGGVLEGPVQQRESLRLAESG